MAKNKSIYFPSNESGTGQAERVSVSTIRIAEDESFDRWVDSLDAKQLRIALRLNYSELVKKSKEQLQSVSSIAIHNLREAWSKGIFEFSQEPSASLFQLPLFPEEGFQDERQTGKNGTFSYSKYSPIQRWYPYLEGFSEDFADSYFDEFCQSEDASIFDPFCGSGTTAIAALKRGWRSSYCEINPFMVEVIHVKTDLVPRLFKSNESILATGEKLCGEARRAQQSLSNCQELIQKCFPGRPYFQEKQLQEFVTLKQQISEADISQDMARVLRFALACIAIGCSNLKRAGDVRYRRPKEIIDPNFSVFDAFLSKVAEIEADAHIAFSQFARSPELASSSILDVNVDSGSKHRSNYDLVFTSPPYLNGTNYIRNTKLELWTTGLISEEKDLSPLRRSAITSGINDVFSENRLVTALPWVEEVATELDRETYDKRIPLMIRSYMSDAQIWVGKCFSMLKPEGVCIIDIGDSNFAGVHVPTVEWIARTCELTGMKVEDVREIRKRKSKNGAPLKQSVIVARKSSRKFAKPQRTSIQPPAQDLAATAQMFARTLPYRDEPYSARNWGHPLHSLCSYQGKLKPALAHFLVKEFTQSGDRVLDPLSGAGTIPLEALQQGRVPVANDLQELAYILSTAKSGVGDSDSVVATLWEFLEFIDANQDVQDSGDYAGFGFNGKLPEYYHPKTLREILAGRLFVKKTLEQGDLTWPKAVVFSCWLHILHGNRPYALSRRSHPVTPFKPTGESEYRDVESRLIAKVNRSLEAFDSFDQKNLAASARLGDFKDLRFRNTIDAVITSPPFANSTRFYVANWLRLWATGWEPNDFKVRPEHFIETKQKKSYDIYSEFFGKCKTWLKRNGVIVLHLGKSKDSSMADQIAPHALESGFSLLHRFDECVANCEKFGVRDQGATTKHEFIILQKT